MLPPLKICTKFFSPSYNCIAVEPSLWVESWVFFFFFLFSITHFNNTLDFFFLFFLIKIGHKNCRFLGHSCQILTLKINRERWTDWLIAFRRSLSKKYSWGLRLKNTVNGLTKRVTIKDSYLNTLHVSLFQRRYL